MKTSVFFMYALLCTGHIKKNPESTAFMREARRVNKQDQTLRN